MMSQEKIIEYKYLADKISALALDIAFERKSAKNKPDSEIDQATGQTVFALINIIEATKHLFNK